MKLSQQKCLVVGVRAGEVAISLLNPEQPKVEAYFVLLREDGTNSGKYTKAGGWTEKAAKAFQDFIEALEEDVLRELFESSGDAPQAVVGDTSEPPQDVPTLGDKKGVPQI